MAATAHLRLRRHWALDPEVNFLNHGSFGACPRTILDLQSELRARLEREPVRFMVDELPPLLDGVREALGSFLRADPEGFALVPNATWGVNTVLRSLDLSPGDELLFTSHGYGACRNALEFVAHRAGARVVTAAIPFPVTSADQIIDSILAAVTPKTKVALIDHVTSPTALVFPVERLVPALQERGIDVLVDGAHAPGMLDLDLEKLGAAWYVGNCHKWLCAPKGAAFLHVRDDHRAAIRPLVISHGATAALGGRTRFRHEFDWTGTDDPTPFLCIPECIRFLGTLVDGGWPALRATIHDAAVDAQRVMSRSLGIAAPAPPQLLGSMTALPLPDGSHDPSHFATDPVQRKLFTEHHIEVMFVPWPAPPKRLIRVATPLYVDPEDVAALAAVLPRVL